MSRQLIVAHDLGTSGDKASLHDADGRLLASHTVHYSTDYGPGGKAEQDPADWWDAVCEASRRLLTETGATADEVACVAMSGQMMGVVLVDVDDRPVRPAVIWADTRALEEASILIERIGLERAYDLLGHRIDATYSLPKLMWLRAHEPEAYGRATSFLLAKDYITLRLTGRRCTDPSDASGTDAYDQRAGTWSSLLLDAAEIDTALLPEVVPSATVAGGLLAAAAAATGLREGTPVVVGGGDGATAALGAGLVHQGSGANATIGSSAWISVASDTPVRDPSMRLVTFDHVVPGHFVPLGAMQAAGASVDWLAETLEVPKGPPLAELLDAAGGVEAATDGLFYLPYLLGERSPIWNARARGSFIGISRHHGAAHMARAVMEGVAFNLYTILVALEELAGSIDVVDAIGGGARSDVWLRIMADTWGVPVRRRTIVDEANSLGAAVVGGMATGLIDAWGHAGSLSQVEATFEPDDARHAVIRPMYRRFAESYQRLETWF